MRRLWLALVLVSCQRPVAGPATDAAPAPAADAALRDAPAVAPTDPALAALSRACADGDAPACRDLAARVTTPCTAAGNPDACGHLGTLELMGFAVPRDTDAAVAHLASACEARHGDACAALAGMHVAGWILPEDPLRAADLADRGCDLGSADACFLAGDLARMGGGANAAARASALYDKACAGHSPEGCLFAGVGHRREGRRAEALAAFDAGCALALPSACDAARHLRGEASPPAPPTWAADQLVVQLVPDNACTYPTLVPQTEDTLTFSRSPDGRAFAARLASQRYVYFEGASPTGDLYMTGDSYRIERSVMTPVMWVLETRLDAGRFVGGVVRAAPGNEDCEQSWRVTIKP